MSLFKKRSSSFDRRKSIVVAENNTRVTSNGYTRLKDNVMFINADGKHKVLQVESAVAHEGKTTVVGNLAVSLGYTEKKVVVIDLDFRRPRVHRMFGLFKEQGVAEFVKGSLSEKDIIKKTEYKNVDVITRGEEVFNPALVLTSDKFKGLVESLRNQYDYVILDCPPILQTSDYIHISKVADGVLLVVAHAKTTKSQLKESVAELKKNDIDILGSLFTMTEKRSNKSYYHMYSDDYYAIDTEEKTED